MKRHGNPCSRCVPNAGGCKEASGRRLITVSRRLPIFLFVLIAYASKAQAQEVNRSPAVSYDWTGPYIGGQLGIAWGNSSWNAGRGSNGSTSLFQHIDNGGSFLGGLQAGYDYMLPNRVLLGAGWANGNVEPWDFTDIDWTGSGGVSVSGSRWGRPNDTVGIGGAINAIYWVHQAYFNLGGLGILMVTGSCRSRRSRKYSRLITASL